MRGFVKEAGKPKTWDLVSIIEMLTIPSLSRKSLRGMLLAIVMFHSCLLCSNLWEVNSIFIHYR
jgi:hypothetical protein